MGLVKVVPLSYEGGKVQLHDGGGLTTGVWQGLTNAGLRRRSFVDAVEWTSRWVQVKTVGMDTAEDAMDWCARVGR